MQKKMGEVWIEEGRREWEKVGLVKVEGRREQEKVGLQKVEENRRRLDYRREKRMGEGWIIEGRRELEKVGLKKVEKDVLDLERRGRKELFKR